MNLCSDDTYGSSEAGLLLGRYTGHVAEMAWRTLGQNTLEHVYQYFVQTDDLDKPTMTKVRTKNGGKSITPHPLTEMTPILHIKCTIILDQSKI